MGTLARGRVLIFALLLAFLWLANNSWRDVLLQPLETKIWDQYQRWGIADTTHVPSVVIIDIDDATLTQEQSSWPLPHKRIADLAQLLFEKYSVAAVAFDMVFPKEQDSQASKRLLQLAQQYPLIFSQVLNFDQTEQIGYLGGDMEVEVQLDEKQDIFPKALGYAANFAALAEHRCIGNISVILDSDGLLRHVPSWVEWQGKYYPNLSLQILRCINIVTKKPVLHKYQRQYYRLDAPDMGIELLLEEQGLLRIPYRIKVPYHSKGKQKIEDYARYSDYQVIPAHSILSQSLDQTDKEILAGSIVLIGSSAFGTCDVAATPIAPSLLGVVVHAQLLDWMLGGNQAQDDWMVAQGNSHLAPITWIYALMWLWIVVTLLSLWWLLKENHVVMALLFVLAMAVAWWWIGYYFWLVKQWWIPVLPLLAYGIFGMVQIPLEWFFAQQKAKRLQHLFQGYLPASVMAKLLKENNQQVLLPQRKHLTILFADIEDFTKRAENSEPEEIAQLTQQILEQLTQAIYRHQGTVDKYMGDAVMAFWNAPLEQKQHADLALAAAQDILQSIRQFNQQYPELSPAIKVRIGINSGDVIVGDLGTSIRHSYTALGDAVNVASRLQELAKETPYCMLLSQYVVEDTTLTHTFHYVDRVKLRGKSAYEKIYTLQLPKSICSLDKN